MKTQEEIKETYSIKRDGDLVIVALHEALPDAEESGLQAEMLAEELIRIAEQEPDKGLPFLIDLREVGPITYISERERNAFIKLAKSRKIFGKSAVLGEGFFLKAVVNIIMDAVGKGDRVKWFQDEAEARTWLSQPRN